MPNLFIVGAPRCGTSSLFEYLAAHPDVFGPSEKEPHFYDRDVLGPGGPTAEEYAALYAPAAGERLQLDASTLYLYSPGAPEAIRRDAPDAQVVVAIRDPVDLVDSWHRLLVASGAETIADLSRAIAAEPRRREGRDVPIGAVPALLLYTDIGRYARHVDRWRDAFGAGRVHVVALEELEAHPEETCAALLRSLGLEPVPGASFPHVNPARRTGAAPLLVPLNRSVPLRAVARTLLPRRVRRSVWQRVTRALTPFGERPPVDPELRLALAPTFAAETALLERVRGVS